MAAELRLIQNDEARQVFPLPQGVLTIGRDPTNHIQLDSPAVHARHARIFTVGDSSVIQDIAGSSGIFVNDDEIVHRKLCDEDIIYIGSHRFQFINPAAPARSDTTLAGPQPAAGDGETLKTAVGVEPGPVAAPAEQPVQADDPPTAAATPVEADDTAAGVTGSADSTDAPCGVAEAPQQDAAKRSGNIYPYPAPMAPADAEVEDAATPEAEADPLPAAPPLALVADNDGAFPANDLENIEDAAVLPLRSDTPVIEQETLSLPGEASGEPETAGDAPDIPPLAQEQDPLLAPPAPAELEWDVGPAGGHDYPTQTDEGPAGDPAREDAETAATVHEPAADPVLDGPSLPAMADTATPPVEAAGQTPELVDFPPFMAGIEVLSGPNTGKRLMFSRSRIVLGRNGGRSVIIERHDNEYRVRSADRGAAATVNGTLLLQEPVPLADGDRIEFADLSARFFQRSSISEQS